MEIEHEIMELSEETGVSTVKFKNPWRHKDFIQNDPHDDVYKIVHLPFANGKFDREEYDRILADQKRSVYQRMLANKNRFGEHVYPEPPKVKAPVKKKR